jgi:hypothetical protein
MTVWILIVSTFLSVVPGRQPSLIGQGRTKPLARFVFPTAEACEAAKEGVREFAETANQSLIISSCTEETR